MKNPSRVWRIFTNEIGWIVVTPGKSGILDGREFYDKCLLFKNEWYYFFDVDKNPKRKVHISSVKIVDYF